MQEGKESHIPLRGSELCSYLYHAEERTGGVLSDSHSTCTFPQLYEISRWREDGSIKMHENLSCISAIGFSLGQSSVMVPRRQSQEGIVSGRKGSELGG